MSAARISAAQIAEALGARQNGKGWIARCVAHDDSHPSMTIADGANGQAVVHCHSGCSQAALIEALRARGLWSSSPSGGITVAELAIAKSLPEALLHESGFSDDDVNGRDVVRIEYRDAAGAVICTRYRGSIGANGDGPRFWFRRGDKQQLFGLWRLRAEDVIVVEGETDSVALWAEGFNAIGVPGADAWRDDRFGSHLERCPVIYVHVEPDDGGRKFRDKFAASQLRDRVRFFSVTGAKDPCELRARAPAAFRAAIEAAIANSEPPAASPSAPQSTEPPSRFLDTDMANAARLARRHGTDLRFTTEAGWLVWDGTRWAEDEREVRMQALAKETALAIFDEIRDAPDRDAIMRHAKRSQSKPAIDNMIALARSESGIPAALTDFDADPFLLNVQNGTIELRSGKLREHRREDLITKLVAINYQPGAECERWDSFIWRICAGDEDLRAYVRRVLGYLLTGSTIEQVLHFLYGIGANGKSVFCEMLAELLGDYAVICSAELVMLRRHGGIPNDVARLRGARAALMNETTQGARFDEAKLKDLTGGDSLTARFLHREFFDFRPTHKLIIRGNYKPSIVGTDEGIWRRLRLVPFTVCIPPDEQDRELLSKLRAELPGILKWAVDGCLEWQRVGLEPPACVCEAVREYRAEADTLGRFVEEHCTVRQLAQVKSGIFFQRYQQFAEQAGERWIPAKDLPHEMERRGFTHKRGTGGQRLYLGIELAQADASWPPE